MTLKVMKIMNTAIPFHDYGKAPENEAWSAPTLADFTDQSWDELSDAEKRRIQNHFVWMGDSDGDGIADSFGDLGGPHHRPSKDGVGPAVWRAVSSGRMSQASWFGNAGVKAHLAGHYKQFDKTPPWEDSSERLRHIQSGNRPWYEIKAQDDGTADIYLFDEISWLGINAKDFVDELVSSKAREITLHINSPGGSVFDGIAIFQALRAMDAKITTRVEGIAASAASIVAMAGDEVVMVDHSTLMIHDAWAMTIGNAEDHAKQADILNQLSDEIASIYSEQNGKSVDEMRQAMREETWYSAKQALAAGLATRIDTTKKPEPIDRFDLSVFSHVPSELTARLRDVSRPTKRDAERALRDVGFAAKVAKTIVSKGLTEYEDAPLHPAYTGSHIHPHPANGSQGEDVTHSHAHTHEGDSNHSHMHEGNRMENDFDLFAAYQRAVALTSPLLEA